MTSDAISPFVPLAIGAHYPTIERGLSADALAARALGGQALLVCTGLVVAGGGRVTDVLEVPSDTVAAQLEHAFATCRPTGARVGIVGSAASARDILRLVGQHLAGPLVLDVTLSGPSGEDLAEGDVRETLKKGLALADLVAIRQHDAALFVGMEIETMDDAQVAVQRLHHAGARAVLLRGQPSLDAAGTHRADLFFDGEDFALFEAPALPLPAGVHGASSALLMAVLKGLHGGLDHVAAIQQAKAFVTDALRFRSNGAIGAPAYYFAFRGQHPPA